MAKQSCCHKKKLRRGLWSPEEDDKLMNHIAKYGHGCWSSVPKLAGLERCGKSCRLRWINYLRPDLKRGTFSQEEEDLIIQLHSMLGNKWSQIAAQLPGRTDNEVKNFWNSYIKKKLRERGIDPTTHKPLADSTTTASAGSGDRRVATSTVACRAVFSDGAELIPTTTTTAPVQAVPPLVEPTMPQLVDGLKLPLEYWSTAPSSLSGYHQALSLQQQAAAFDMDALSHCGGPPAVAVPSASRSSTLTSMAGLSPGAEQCTNVAAGANLPWLDLAHNNGVVGVDHYAGALDELRWADYFDGAFHAAAATQQGQCMYDAGSGGNADDAVQFVDVHSLSNWC
ncbi:hypothetical protein ABZP36_018190 [Zizania latifolia]